MNGYPVFFKEDRIYKVYGSLPSDFEVLGSATLGLAQGSGSSLAVAGETLFYLNRSGVMAYSGGVPQCVGEAFGLERYEDAVGGSDGLNYYVSMRGRDGWGLYVYDTRRGLWHREDDLQVTHFARYDGALYMLSSDGSIWIANCDSLPAGAQWEQEVPWLAEFADFTVHAASFRLTPLRTFVDVQLLPRENTQTAAHALAERCGAYTLTDDQSQPVLFSDMDYCSSLLPYVTCMDGQWVCRYLIDMPGLLTFPESVGFTVQTGELLRFDLTNP